MANKSWVVAFAGSTFLHGAVLVSVPLLKVPQTSWVSAPSALEVTLLSPDSQFLHKEKLSMNGPAVTSVRVPNPDLPLPKIEKHSERVHDISQEASLNLNVLSGALTEALPLDIKNKNPKYPRRALQAGWEGVVELEALIDEQGKVKDVKLIESSNYWVLDDRAIKALSEWFFQPATLAGRPIEKSVDVRIVFELKGEY